METRVYVTEHGDAPFEVWFERLDAVASAKIVVALGRLELGNLSNAKAVGEGVLEYRIDWGPGYRVYFGRRSNEIIVLLVGGSKKRQAQDIRAAKAYWSDFKKRNRD
jgi:putative addiction module killer protein